MEFLFGNCEQLPCRILVDFLDVRNLGPFQWDLIFGEEMSFVRCHDGFATRRSYAILSFFCDEQHFENAVPRHDSTSCLLSVTVEHTHDEQCPCTRIKLSTFSSHCFDSFLYHGWGSSALTNETCFRSYSHRHTLRHTIVWKNLYK